MDSDPREGHPNSREAEHLLCNSHPVAYGWSWDFNSGKRVTYDIRKGFLEVHYTDKGNPMEGYPKEMDEEGLVQLLRAVLQLEGTMSKKFVGEIRQLFEELNTLVQDGSLKVDNTRGKEVDDDVLEDVRERARKLNELLKILEPKLPEILPKQQRDAIANLQATKVASKSVNSDKLAEKPVASSSPFRLRRYKSYS
jgi:hypothetical protein